MRETDYSSLVGFSHDLYLWNCLAYTLEVRLEKIGSVGP